MNKLKLDNHQLNAMVEMLDASCNYYNQRCIDNTLLVDLVDDVLRRDAIISLYQVFFKAQYRVKNSIMTIYRTEYVFDKVEALVFVGSVIPSLNKTYYDSVKQVVIDYCLTVLKQAGVLPNIPTYKHPVEQLAASYPKPIENNYPSFYNL